MSSVAFLLAKIMDGENLYNKILSFQKKNPEELDEYIKQFDSKGFFSKSQYAEDCDVAKAIKNMRILGINEFRPDLVKDGYRSRYIPVSQISEEFKNLEKMIKNSEVNQKRLNKEKEKENMLTYLDVFQNRQLISDVIIHENFLENRIKSYYTKEYSRENIDDVLEFVSGYANIEKNSLDLNNLEHNAVYIDNTIHKKFDDKSMSKLGKGIIVGLVSGSAGFIVGNYVASPGYGFLSLIVGYIIPQVYPFYYLLNKCPPKNNGSHEEYQKLLSKSGDITRFIKKDYVNHLALEKLSTQHT